MDRRNFLSLAKTTGAISIGLTVGMHANIVNAETKSKHVFNAADYGLEPNISSDQTNILQQAIDAATAKQQSLFIPAGFYNIKAVTLPTNCHIFGVNGQTKLIQKDDSPIILCENVANIQINTLIFEGNFASSPNSKIIDFSSVDGFMIEQCKVYNSQGNGFMIYKSTGQIIANEFSSLGHVAIFATDCKNLKIIRNTIQNIDNNGILIWQGNKADDGSIISHNHISKIDSKAGGTGQNGNGINIFKANKVIVSENQFDDCFFSAVRINNGDNCQIINNNCSNIGEVALYAEFAFNGVIINNNMVDLAAAGISISNLNDNGHLAVCKGNLLRNLTLRFDRDGENDPRSFGIAAEGDVLIEGNVIENATSFGIGGGYGAYQRNLSIVNNMVKDCGYGIIFSVAPNAGKVAISNNSIANGRKQAIAGFEWDKIATDDLIHDNQKFDQGSYANVHISNNVTI